MNLRRVIIAAMCIAPFTGAIALAQFPPPQGQLSSCVQEFTKLREATEKRGTAIREASQHKASPKEACGLFNAFVAAEAKMLKYAVDNATWCGIPQQIIDSIKQGHSKSNEIRIKVCRVAEAPQRPAGPTLSDALSNPIPNANNIKTGRGTFDTLTGSPLGK